MKTAGILFLVLSLFCLESMGAPSKQRSSSNGRASSERYNSITADENRSEPMGFTDQGFVLTPYLQYVFLNPTQLNSYLSNQAQKNEIIAAYRIGGTPGFGANADFYVMPNLAFGVKLEYFQSSTDAVTIKKFDRRATSQSTLSAVPIYATATYTGQMTEHFELGSTFGLGVPLSFTYSSEISGSTIEGMPNGTNSYSASPTTWMIQGFGRYRITDHMALQLNAGYRYLMSSQFKANEAYGKTVKEGDLLVDESSAGTNVKINASSFLTSMGLAVSF